MKVVWTIPQPPCGMETGLVNHLLKARLCELERGLNRRLKVSASDTLPKREPTTKQIFGDTCSDDVEPEVFSHFIFTRQERSEFSHREFPFERLQIRLTL
jgi:hypothetical protein